MATTAATAGIFQQGNVNAQLASDGEIEGVRPVALPMPSYARGVTITRELVTRDRPLQPTLIYFTDAAMIPLSALWLGCLVLLLRGHRSQLRALRDRARTWLAARPAPRDAVAAVEAVVMIEAPVVEPPPAT